MDLVTPAEAKREAAKGLKQAIAVSIKKFECLLLLTCKEIIEYVPELSESTCGLCWRYGDECGLGSRQWCPLKTVDDCYLAGSQYKACFVQWENIYFQATTTITKFRKETRKMIAILKKLYKEQG